MVEVKRSRRISVAVGDVLSQHFFFSLSQIYCRGWLEVHNFILEFLSNFLRLFQFRELSNRLWKDYFILCCYANVNSKH